jgi:hypothetical protein
MQHQLGCFVHHNKDKSALSNLLFISDLDQTAVEKQIVLSDVKRIHFAEKFSDGRMPHTIIRVFHSNSILFRRIS